MSTPPPDVAEAISRVLGAGEPADWSAVEPEGLPEAAVELARLRNRVEAALVAVGERLEETDALSGSGWADVKAFLTSVTGGLKGAGGGLVKLGRLTRDLPKLRSAFAAGEVSAAQARTIGTKVATLPRVPELREQAADALVAIAREGRDATDVARAFKGVVKELDPDGSLLRADLDKPAAERAAHHARYLSLQPDMWGGVWVKGYGTLEDAELVKATLMPLAAPVTSEPGACGGEPGGWDREDPRRRLASCPDPTCGHDGSDPREPSTRLWDALVETCRTMQATDQVPTTHGTSARLTVTVPLEALRAGLAQAGLAKPDLTGLLASGDELSAAAVRRLACDAEVIPAVLGSAGQVLDVGRTQRLVTTAIWLALVLRDQHCAFPGCDRLPLACDAHHLVHWADGGPTSLDNLVLLCRRHHVLIHQSPWTVHLDAETRRPVWTPPPRTDRTLRPTTHPPPMVA